MALSSTPGGNTTPASPASMTACGATRVGTSHVPRSSMSSIPSSSRKIPCSIERMPARTAFLIPSAAWAWAITNIPAAVASVDQHVQLLGPEVRVGGVVAR